jgi:hypothetical protein
MSPLEIGMATFSCRSATMTQHVYLPEFLLLAVSQAEINHTVEDIRDLQEELYT